MDRETVIVFGVIVIVSWLLVAGIWKTADIISSVFRLSVEGATNCTCRASCSYEEYIKENLDRILVDFDNKAGEFCKKNGFENGFIHRTFYPDEIEVYCYGKMTPEGELSKDFPLSEIM